MTTPTLTTAAPAAPPRLAARSPRTPAEGMTSDEGLAAVEALMAELAGGAEGGPAAAMAREHLAAGGKRLRARLALAVLEALGGRRAAGVAWAAACELLHNASLVHDDLQDGDETRRGRPTVWARHGGAQAVACGDLMLMLPFLALERVPGGGERRFALAACLARRAAAAARGQSAELATARGAPPAWDAWRAAAEGKTGALFQLPVEGAALLAGRGADAARALAAPFAGLGVLFQLQDDVLDLYGDKGRGRPGDDLREGKASALVVEHLALCPGDAAWLLPLLARPRGETPDAEVARAIDRFRAGGALDAVLRRIRAEAEGVLRHRALRAEPALRELAAGLARVALAPISHVVDARAAEAA